MKKKKYMKESEVEIEEKEKNEMKYTKVNLTIITGCLTRLALCET